jgi:hypothetical protein
MFPTHMHGRTREKRGEWRSAFSHFRTKTHATMEENMEKMKRKTHLVFSWGEGLQTWPESMEVVEEKRESGRGERRPRIGRGKWKMDGHICGYLYSLQF